MDDNRDDPRKYLVLRSDFRRLIRWPGDGIEQNQCQPDEHNEFHSSNPDQLALTQLMGGWVFYEPLEAMGDEHKWIAYSLPWYTQYEAAQELQDEEAATTHLLDSYRSRNESVREVLDKIGCKSAVHKASKVRNRFPGTKAILYPLFRHNLASQNNIELLFGDVMRVLAHVMDVGEETLNPPMPSSPRAAKAAPFQKPKITAAAKECGECHIKAADVPYRKCSACKGVFYCSKACQRKNWVLHKPECLALQHKPVPESAMRKAEQERNRRTKEEQDLKRAEHNAYKEQVRHEVFEFLSEPASKVETWSRNCYGQKRRVALTRCGVHTEEYIARRLLQLEVEYELELLTFPEGIDSSKMDGRGLLLKREDGAKIMILHELLFGDGGNGNINGYVLDGIWVVASTIVVRSEKKAKWRRVSEPQYDPSDNRFLRLAGYLEKSIVEAKTIPDDADHGIHHFDYTKTVLESYASAYPERFDDAPIGEK